MNPNLHLLSKLNFVHSENISYIEQIINMIIMQNKSMMRETQLVRSLSFKVKVTGSGNNRNAQEQGRNGVLKLES